MKKPPTIHELRDNAEAEAYAHANAQHSNQNKPFIARRLYDFGSLGMLLIEWRGLSWSKTWFDSATKINRSK